MPVNTPHRIYTNYITKWDKCRTVALGEDEVKDAGEEYLPKLTKQDSNQYDAYKMRALFYGATSRTVEGLSGAIFRKTPTISETPEQVTDSMKSVTAYGQSTLDLSKTVVYELLITGRFGILADAPKDGGEPYLTEYQAEKIINWKFESSEEYGTRLILLVLQEMYDELLEDDDFESEEKTRYRVLKIENDQYKVEIWEQAEDKDGEEGDSFLMVDNFFPTVRGKNLYEIPFQFFNPINSSDVIYDPPLLPLVNVNLSHYRTSADLEHGRHFTGLPTAWVAGFDVTDELRIGSQVAWVSDDPKARAGFLEFTGQGLTSLENAMKEKQEMMAVLGARMLEEQKKAVDAAETHGMRRRGENNVLNSLSMSVSESLSKIINILLQWRGFTAEVIIELNTDFIADRLGSSDLKELMGSWQQGGISWDTLFYNLKKGEIIPEGRTAEEEKELIQQDGDMLKGSEMNLDGDKNIPKIEDEE